MANKASTFMLMVDQMIMTSYYINLDSLLVRIKQTQKRTWLLSTIIHSSWSHHWPCTWSVSHIPCQFQIQICHLEFQICLGEKTINWKFIGKCEVVSQQGHFLYPLQAIRPISMATYPQGDWYFHRCLKRFHLWSHVM